VNGSREGIGICEDDGARRHTLAGLRTATPSQANKINDLREF
jgi:hypothetical protein